MRTIRSAKAFFRSRRFFSSFCILPYYFTLQAKAVARVTSFGFAFFTADFLAPFFALLARSRILSEFPLPNCPRNQGNLRAYNRHSGKSKKVEIKRQKREIEVKGRRPSAEGPDLFVVGLVALRAPRQAA
jgi:hypothetical protein